MLRGNSFRLRYFHPSSVRRFVLIASVVSLTLCLGRGFAQEAPQAQSNPPDASQQTVPPPPPDITVPNDAAQPGNDVRVVRLTDVEGEVKVYQGDHVAFEQAEPNMPAVQGMRFVTSANGRLEIQFEDGSVARVTPNSSIRLTKLRRNEDGTTASQIDALSGLSYFELNGGGRRMTVHFDTEVATPIDSAVFRISLDAAPNELAVMHGTVHVDDGQNVAVDIHPNQTFQTNPQNSGEFTVAQSLTADSWDQWNSDRDDALAKLGADQTTARASAGNPDDAAWNDLDDYGNWYDLPGYGAVWAPAGVDQNWDPFGVGYWGYYAGFGYTWISGYPWGWWPYHCGAWNFGTGWGWMWIPSNCGWGFWGPGWHPYVNVWQMPRGYKPPPRPRHGPGPFPRPIPLYAVNRGGQFVAPFRHLGGIRPQPRSLAYDGRVIKPIEPGIHPRVRGPLGESFTTSLVRQHPEMAPEFPAALGPYTSGPAGAGRFPGGSGPALPRINPGGTIRPVPPVGGWRGAPGGGSVGNGVRPPAGGAPPVGIARPLPGGGHVTPGPVGGVHPGGGAPAPHPGGGSVAPHVGGGPPAGGGGGGPRGGPGSSGPHP